MKNLLKILLMFLVLALDYSFSSLTYNFILWQYETTGMVNILIILGLYLTYGFILSLFAIWYYRSLLPKEDDSPNTPAVPVEEPGLSSSGKLTHKDGLPHGVKITYSGASTKPSVTHENHAYTIEFGNATIRISLTGSIDLSISDETFECDIYSGTNRISHRN